MITPIKPLGIKAYGSIPHLPGSRRGPGDHGLSDEQAAILTTKARDHEDLIIVEEKLDGSCVSVANIDGEIVPLIRAGYRAENSHHEQHHHFASWVKKNEKRFRKMLEGFDRICGEWLLQAHGTRYALEHEPFVAFDFFLDNKRVHRTQFWRLCRKAGIVTPRVLHIGGPVSVEKILSYTTVSGHGRSFDGVEGAVWRCERNTEVDFLGKYVKPEKKDGIYLPEISGQPPIWNYPIEKL